MFLAHSAKGYIQAQSYQAHVSNVYKMAFDNAVRAGTYSHYGELMKETVALAALYHDLGKLAPENQKVLKSSSKKSLPFNHVDAGVAALQSGDLSLPENLAALFVYSHHIGLQSLPDESAKGKGKVFRDTSLNQDGRAVKEIIDKYLSDYLESHKSQLSDMPEVKKSEWHGTSPTPLCMRIALSCLVDADHTDTARHYNNIIPEGEILLSPDKRLTLLDKYVAGLTQKASDDSERNRLRQAIYKSCRNAPPSDKGFITCDSPVGTGKTTAVMAHLLNVARTKKLRRIFVVLPFTNIIDQSVDIYRNLVLTGESPEKAVAAHHHKAEFEDISSRVFSFLWNAPITVTTAVQFFETLASNHPASLRKLHQLAGSAIFIDEAHAALPAPLWAQALKWLKELVDDWGCYVVLASGSLNRFWELEEFSNPPLKNIPELVDDTVRKSALEGESIRIKYERKQKPLNADELCKWIKELRGPRLIILNTVQSAASVAKKLLESYGDRKFVEQLSTALAPIHRKEILERIKQRLKNPDDKNWTLVATSCVEAGIDFSFRTAAREYCSLISTIQTAGRINRSGEHGESELWNFQIVPGDSLKEHPSFATSARILKQFFDERKVAPEYCTEAMKREVREKNQLNADSNPVVISERNKDFPAVKDQFRVIPANTVTAIIDREMCERIERHEKVDFTELQQKSVAIYSNNINKFALRPLRGFNDLYDWMLDYDQDFLGYMAGVLKTGDIKSYVI
ncbi:MAG: CRISPR-associated endonuclease Cas3'' [Nitrospirae bacterium]|nr:CRISPR-associated endonuclease Cas3'' [Nitrospirota bacterium]